MKKIIISLVIIASFVLVACGGGKSDKKAEVEKMLLQGHSWGETENESKSIGMSNYKFFGLNATSTSKPTQNSKNQMFEMFYCFSYKDNEITKSKYRELVKTFEEELGTKPTEWTKSELTFNDFFVGSLKYTIQYRDCDGTEDYIYIYITNDKYDAN